MRLAVTFGFNQAISHGFGMFLFAALVPMMQQTLDINSWYLALAGALTQIAYLCGAMLLGVIGHRLDSGRTLLVTGSLTSSFLFIMGWLDNPVIMICLLAIMAISAAMSWGSIVELVTRHGRADRTATNLSIASSGTAWGYSVNGLIILLIAPLLGWRSSWMAAAVLGMLVVFTTFTLLKSMRNQAQSQDIDVNFAVAMGTKQLFKTVLRERTAFLSCFMLLLVGASTITFTTWLNTYLAELSLPSALGGYTWGMIGLTGMIAGFFVGKLADKKGHGVALLSIFGVFALSLVAFSFHPAKFVMLAGFGYGMMYFPIWGIVAGWVNKQYSSKATMQINGIGMVTFGLGGTLGNLLAGMIHEATGSLQNVYWLISALGIALFILAMYIYQSERQTKTSMVGDISPTA
ncbi:Major Facilitator Superfamily protein [Marinomonas spartinae]|uniref:MFS transporter n=1 Tax=Marinomonas spartinae TaxID=1792290 RepID=UPI000808F716|nr:MFS transporter [Marinomonas spartinae]SBS34307.1 Major Facilitator Superfamily protein [Marinomonas spartinae]